jgi:protein-tyrosine phosphatase
LRLWEEAGITDVFDMREEANDTEFIHKNSRIISHWQGVDDDGRKKDDAWFKSMCEKARIILNDTTRPRRILVHCHMGVNRGPSALFAIMLAMGWESLYALRAIRDARPISGIIYAPDAINWWAREQSHDSGVVAEMVHEVEAWLDRNPLDLYYVIRSIGNRRAI